MKVLMISGDRSFGPGHPRFELQKSAVEKLEVVYWGRGALWPQLPKEHFDVVSVQDPVLRGVFAWRAAKKMEARLNVQVHMDLQGLLWWRRILAKIVLRHADSIRVVSQKIKEQVESIGVHGAVSVLPVYIDVEKFRKITPVSHDQKTILWVGRFEPEKDPLYALKVLKEVRAHVDARLVMLGAGSLEPKLRRTAAGLPVEFPGWQPSGTYLAVADVVVCTSRHESWGASLVEALAAGVPVVAPDVGVAREAGALVVPKKELGKKIIEVLSAGVRGELKLVLPPAFEWAQLWRDTL